MSTRGRRVTPWLAVTVILTGCSRENWEGTTYQRGDTTVVRTLSGSVWGDSATLVEEARIGSEDQGPEYVLRGVAALAGGGEGDVYVADARVPALRVYDKAGRHKKTIGAPGRGTGTYAVPIGVVLLPDGRIVLSDPSRAQFNVYSSRGTFLEEWPQPRNIRLLPPFFLGADGSLYHRFVYDPRVQPHNRQFGYVRYSLDGELESQMRDPDPTFQPVTLTAVAQSGEVVPFVVPFSPLEHWLLTPQGAILRGISDEYAVDVTWAEGSVVRLERVAPPVMAQKEEIRWHYQRVDRRATEIDYKWTWRGPVIPETKPPFKDFFMDRGGRIWVQLHQPASPVEVLNEDGEPAGQRWTEPVAYDVFETGGRYLGHVETPPGFRTIPQPLIEGDVVWAVVRQFEGEPSVVRFRIDH